MSRRALAARITALVETEEQAERLHIVATIKVHGRREELDGTRCPCCGSADAVIVQEIVGADLVIDVSTGERTTADNYSDEAWAEFTSDAQRHDVAIRCSTVTLPLLLDESPRHIMASGGNRASKTTTGLYWLALRYLRHGGYQRRFWLVSITEKDCFELLEKLFLGTPSPSGGTVPAILPAALVAQSPETYRASNKQTRTVDGALIDLIPFKNDPNASRGKKHPIVAALVDEAANLPAPAWLATLRGRCVDFGGRLWLASTATPSSFLKEDVIDKVEEWDRLDDKDPIKISGAHEGAAWLNAPLAMVDNPWVPLAFIENAMRTLDMSKPENQRDFLGVWRANEGLFWEDKFIPEQHTYAHEHRDMARWSPQFLAEVNAVGHVPITGRVRTRICSNPSRNPHHATIKATNGKWLIGQDVNFRMESVLVQVSAPPDDMANPDAWHFWVQDCKTSVRSNSDAHAATLVSIEFSKVLDPGGSGRTLDGALVVMDATAITAVDPHQTRHHQSGSIVDTFARHNLEVRAPSYRKSDNKWKKQQPERAATFAVVVRLLKERRLHVSSKCGPLLEAFSTQLSEPNGYCPLDARRGKWDERMGPVDALRYLLYAATNSKPPTVVQDWGSLPQSVEVP
jgi:hypothetical protein